VKVKSIHITAWPEYDPKLLIDSSITLVIQVNGKLRSTVLVDRGIDEGKAVKIALADPKIKQILSGQYTKKIIFVKDRLINFVV
jgi:leucyl-tRNA synthetase